MFAQRNILYAVLYIFLICIKISAQPAGNYSIRSGKHSITIPFKLDLNHLVLQVKDSNQNELDLILDTGMPGYGILLFEGPKTKNIEFQNSSEIMVGGPGGEPSPAKMASGLSLTLGEIEFNNLTAIIMPFDSSRSLNLKEDGVIGLEIFSRFVVDIDNENNKLTLTEPDYFNYFGQGSEIPLDIVRNMPYLFCNAEMESGEIVQTKLVIDIGASHALSLNLSTQKEIVLPAKTLEVRTGRSVSAEIYGKVGRIKNLQLGSYSIDYPIVSFHERAMHPAEKEGNLGSGILHRFNTIFDYKNKRMILEPNKFFNDPFDYDMTGMQTSKTKTGFYKIDKILPSSPASENNLRVGDVIIELNGQTASEITPDEMRKMFVKNGEAINLRIMRADKELSFSIKLRPLI
ncbi:PDZ domain-containing protein [Bacteroidota bacterium]